MALSTYLGHSALCRTCYEYLTDHEIKFCLPRQRGNLFRNEQREFSRLATRGARRRTNSRPTIFGDAQQKSPPR